MKTLQWLTPLTSTILLAGSVSAAPININQASAEEIASALNGIGQAKASAIVAHRAEYGPFRDVRELVDVNGIGERLLERIKVDLRLDDEN